MASPAPPSRIAGPWLAAVQRGDRVRITTHSGRTVKGKVRDTAEAAIFVDLDDPPLVGAYSVIPTSAIEALTWT